MKRWIWRFLAVLIGLATVHLVGLRPVTSVLWMLIWLSLCEVAGIIREETKWKRP